MKKQLIILLLPALTLKVFSQQPATFEYTGRRGPSVKLENLGKAVFLSDIMPDFSRQAILDPKDSEEFRKLTSIVEAERKMYIYPGGLVLNKKENYEEIIGILSSIISITEGGIITNYTGTGELLSKEEKNGLLLADPGSDIAVKVKFIYKDWAKNTAKENFRIREAEYHVAAIPAKEAEYPGGNKALSDYLNRTIFSQLSGKSERELLSRTKLRFTIDEKGKPFAPMITGSSADVLLDQLILQSFRKMPDWKPAENSAGQKLSQEFSISFGGGEGC